MKNTELGIQKQKNSEEYRKETETVKNTETEKSVSDRAESNTLFVFILFFKIICAFILKKYL